MHRLRVIGRHDMFSGHPAWKRLAAKSAMALLWPIGSLTTAIRCGLEQKAAPSRILDAWLLAVHYNIPPLEYFLYKLWLPERRARLDDYLYWTENTSSLMVLNRAAGWCPGPCPVSDKQLFDTFCTRLGLRAPSLLAVWNSGQQEEGGSVPRRDLWLKPARTKSGIGAERWIWVDGTYRRRDRVLQRSQMEAHIAGHSRTHGKTLVQTVVKANKEHIPYVGETPLCARIVTGRRHDGSVEIIAAAVVWPRPGSEVTQGGDMALIETSSGRICEIHEATQTSASRGLEGKILPDWQYVLAVVRKGHTNLPHYVFLGWDVAFGDDGPLLLETNSGWGSLHLQMMTGRPIADTAFASIAAEYV
ncbi:hypothetical protein MGEO_03085 [Marivita geojedonensis]|uniref:Alpha-L-glutamate ligase-related protein ATP-grasp domain-containing protein n=2 Tax=Marivita geojedonensis TaxID=1123756 RepID=A0A1X4NRS5_9RHOB|nr:sugar-transfer associated ATP-grasp domain-containing protein [Marivita geojedonensis]OSQ53518.1 hypothetical protein MGEO_03085 [Marivita geojedonensis]